MNIIRSIIVIVMSLGLSLAPLFAIQIPAHDAWVTDTADMISDTEEASLESQLQQLQDDTGVEVAILTIPTIGQNDIAQLGTTIAQSRGIGKADIDNGVLILIARDDRKRRIDTGYGVEGLLPDITAYRIGEELRVPHARQGQYYKGFEQMALAISGLVHEDAEMMTYWKKNKPKNTSNDQIGLMDMIIFGCFLGFFLGSMFQSFVKKDIAKYITSAIGGGLWALLALGLVGVVGLVVFVPVFLAWIFGLFAQPVSGGYVSRGGSGRSGGWSSGGRSSGGGSFGGGFGGFGGGSFGGGGAGGSW